MEGVEYSGDTSEQGARFMKPAAKVGRRQAAGGWPRRRTSVLRRSSQPLKGMLRPSSSRQPSRWSHHHQDAHASSSLHDCQHSCERRSETGISTQRRTSLDRSCGEEVKLDKVEMIVDYRDLGLKGNFLHPNSVCFYISDLERRGELNHR